MARPVDAGLVGAQGTWHLAAHVRDMMRGTVCTWRMFTVPCRFAPVAFSLANLRRYFLRGGSCPQLSALPCRFADLAFLTPWLRLADVRA